jgi:TetR/AcrR family transcriptional regulator
MIQARNVNQAVPGRSAGETAILGAAVKLFSEKGYDAVSMRGVAQEAGVSKANIYHHFESKEALYRAILFASAAELSGLVSGLAESGGSFAARIFEFSSAHLGHLQENALTSRLILREAFSGDDVRSKMLVDEVFGEIFERLVSIFRSGQQAGVLRADLDPALCATLLIGADVFFFQAGGVLKHLPQAGFAQNPSRFSKQMVEVMLNGMLGRASGQEAAK